jgi:hypothetical protein
VILYRTSGPWGGGTAANLSAAQVDGNFYDLATRVQFMELNAPAPIQITSFNAIGNQLYINMSDGTTRGPLILPTVRWSFRGPWAPGVNYFFDDVVTAPDGATYLVTFTHLSGPTFDPGANDGQGHDFYSLMLQVPSLTLPVGGGGGAVLTKNSSTNYDMVWRMPSAPPGGVAGQLLKKNSSQNGDVFWGNLNIDEMFDVQLFAPLSDGDYLRWSSTAGQWVNQARPMFNVLRQSSWSPVTGDEGSFMVLINGTADALVAIPNDSDENFPIGSELHIHQDGIGKVRIEGDPGVTIRKHASFSHFLLGQYATATVKKTGANEWRLFGLLAGV